MKNLNQSLCSWYSTNVTCNNSNFEDFKNDTNIEFEFLNKWFKAKWQSMNFHKINFLQFTPKNSPEIDLDISYANKLISKTYDTQFLGIYVENSVMGDSYWPNYTHTNCSFLAVRLVKPFLSQWTL